MGSPRLQKLGQDLLIKRGHITLPVLLGIMLLTSGLGHAFFNPTKEVVVGVLELAASVLLFVGVFLVCTDHVRFAIVCYSIAVVCIVVEVVAEVGILIQQMGR